MRGNQEPKQNKHGDEGRPNSSASSGMPIPSKKTVLSRPEASTTDRVRSHMIAGLIHDVRTPLVAVRGYAKMMLEERAGTLTSTQREYLSIMLENTNRTIPLLKELSELTSEPAWAFEPLGIRDLWEDSLQDWKSRALAKSIQIQEKNLSNSLVVRGNKHMLREAFETLLSNAVKNTQQGGEIIVEFCSDEKEQVEARISEVPAEVAWEPLPDTSSESKTGGHSEHSPWESDAALSLVRDIIEIHGGNISVSCQDQGVSELIVTLPA